MFVKNTRTEKEFITVDGSEIRLLVDRKNSSITSVSLAEAMVPVGGETIWHHLEEMDEIFYILKGEGLMFIGNEKQRLGPGDAVWIRPEEKQRIRNTGKEPLVFLCIVAPAYVPEKDHPDTP